ncbi:MAG: flavodoxin-dependent (E)-4-hydroxy-3-methylbut-2-enyl-diphosphate synthase [Oscillospiraceae bacterium]|nr:flavodoxin-dependent (E)-4-hydroxy-3-methylbut-2-enyl-diphosphate synthase [Oscillospiraceae bacterium]
MVTKRIRIGNIAIGGGERVAVESMLSLPPGKTEENIEQARSLERAGCDIVRTAVPDMQGVHLISALKESVRMPVIADIHFDWRLAIESASAGADMIRINPGNIGDESRVKAVAYACRDKKIPIRVGVNSGSVEKHILAKYNTVTPEALAESAFYHVSLLEKYDFTDIMASMKSHRVGDMMKAYRIAAERTNYPLHLGLTHSGPARIGFIKSAIAIGGLLAEGIGDTIRVSLTTDLLTDEVKAAMDILESVGLTDKPDIISCPGCGRTSINVPALTARVENALKDCKTPVTVAVMGCAVNGPGEAREADIGITGGGNGKCAIFKKGEVAAVFPIEEEAITYLLGELSDAHIL